MLQIAQWASIFPYLIYARIGDVLPADQTSWLYQALRNIRDKYPHYPYPVPVEVQALLWQAKAELGHLFEPDADPAIFNAVITEDGKSLVSQGCPFFCLSPDCHNHFA